MAKLSQFKHLCSSRLSLSQDQSQLNHSQHLPSLLRLLKLQQEKLLAPLSPLQSRDTKPTGKS